MAHRQTHQHHQHQHGERPGYDEAGLAEILDLDAEVSGAYLDEVIAWLAAHVDRQPGTIVDLGAGTGPGSLALARRFPTADLVAVDRSAVMLDRLAAAAQAQGVGDRIRGVQADLDDTWPGLTDVDLVWAALSLHEVADSERVLTDVHSALKPGGLLVVTEMEGLPRFLPDDLGVGRPGLERRCHALLLESGWNAHPDWRVQLEKTGFDVIDQRTFQVEGRTTPQRTAHYARTYLRRIRSALEDRLSAEDLRTLDRLLSAEGFAAVLGHEDLIVRGTRTGWLVRRP